MKRKILMICSIWHVDYARALLRGIDESIEHKEVEVHVMAAYDTSAEQSLQKKAHEIFELPVLRAYDGVLCAASSVGNAPIVRKIVDECKALKIPFLSIDREVEGVASVGIDNYKAVYEMVEHMLKVHNCKVFNYLGGAKTHEENAERFRAYCDCLKKYGIAIEEDRVMHCNFLHSDGRMAYHSWKKIGKHLPDALICANDNMAIGYCEEAAKDGYYAPDDIRVSGFDNFDEGKYFCPSITSVNRDWGTLGRNSMQALLKMVEEGNMQGCRLYSGGRIVLNESCGCGLDRDIRGDLRQVFLEKRIEVELEEKQRGNRQLLCSCNNLADLENNLGRSFTELGIEPLLLCLKKKELTAGKDDGIKLLSSRKLSDNVGTIFEDLGRLLQMPDKKIFIFSSLYFGEITYGYSIAAYENKFMKNNLHRTFMETLSLALENIRQKEEIYMMNQRLQELYIQDSLTGLYNRFGYVQMGERFFEEQEGRVSLIYVDVDNLKAMNDNYGHAMGDLAIKGVASVICEVFTEESVKVRMGGDEFLIITNLQKEEEILRKEEKVTEQLKQYSEKEQLPFCLCVSMGHIRCNEEDTSLETLVKMADGNMYEIKQKKKRNNK